MLNPPRILKTSKKAPAIDWHRGVSADKQLDQERKEGKKRKGREGKEGKGKEGEGEEGRRKRRME
jgi:hypothetical protein